MIKKIYNSILNKITTKPDKEARNFFDYSSKEKKKIIKAATRDANAMQKELIEKYRILSA